MVNGVFYRLAGLAFVVALTSSCVSVRGIPDDYRGDDGGFLVIGIGAAANIEYSSYEFHIRSKAKGPGREDRIAYRQSTSLAGQTRDYSSKTENGVVIAYRMRPGEYEIHAFTAMRIPFNSSNFLRSAEEFSIPFTIQPQKTTYVGNFQANRVWKLNDAERVVDHLFFVVSNRQQVDLALVKQRNPAIQFGLIKNATPNMKEIASRYFVDAIMVPRPNKPEAAGQGA